MHTFSTLDCVEIGSNDYGKRKVHPCSTFQILSTCIETRTENYKYTHKQSTCVDI